MIPGIVISYLTFPGIIVHELAHKLFCNLFDVKVLEFSLFDFKGGGHVVHERPEHFHQMFWIATGPLLVNSVLAILMGAITAFTIPESTIFFAFLWLALSIGMHAIPSNQDARNVLDESKQALSQGGNALHYLSFPFLAVIAITNLLRFFWIDLIWAVTMVLIGFWSVGNMAAHELLGFDKSEGITQTTHEKISQTNISQLEQGSANKQSSVSDADAITEFSIELVSAFAMIYKAGQRYNEADDGLDVLYAFVDGRDDVQKALETVYQYTSSKNVGVSSAARKIHREIYTVWDAYDRSLKIIEGDAELELMVAEVEKLNQAQTDIAFIVADEVSDLYTDADNPVDFQTGKINYTISDAQRLEISEAIMTTLRIDFADDTSNDNAMVFAIAAISQNTFHDDLKSYSENNLLEL